MIKRALEEPFRQIVFNAGLEGSVLLNDVRKQGGTFGFDARNEKMVDMMETARNYKNNVEVLQTAKGLILDTLRLGK